MTPIMTPTWGHADARAPCCPTCGATGVQGQLVPRTNPCPWVMTQL
jgi:hypothetical protein